MFGPAPAPAPALFKGSHRKAPSHQHINKMSQNLNRSIGFKKKPSLEAISSFAIVFTILILLSGIPAQAAFVTVSGSWTGAPFGNSAQVTMTADVDLGNPAFDLGSEGAHQWWYPSSSFANMTVTVTGSLTPAYNGVFNTSYFNWVRIYSSAATPDLALTVPNTADLGNGGPGDTGHGPSDSGPGVLQLGSGLGGGEYVSSLGLSPVPEPTSLSLLAVCGLALCRRRRTKVAL